MEYGPYGITYDVTKTCVKHVGNGHEDQLRIVIAVGHSKYWKIKVKISIPIEAIGTKSHSNLPSPLP